MMGYGAVSQPIKPQRMLDATRAGTPEQYRKVADYLATINLSSVDHWQYELKTLPRPKGRDTRAIVTEYCLPTGAPCAPSGTEWLHEIKHDGIRVIARKQDQRIKLYSRPGNDLTPRFPLIVERLGGLRARSCILDGEAVACGEDGIALFERIRYRRHDASVFMYAFDLIELNGDDLRREPLEVRKAALERVLERAGSGVRFNEHLEAEGPLVFEHACRLGLEGIVSKRKGSRYQSGRSRDWLKAKNPEAPAVTRLAEEDWARSWSSSSGRRPPSR